MPGPGKRQANCELPPKRWFSAEIEKAIRRYLRTIDFGCRTAKMTATKTRRSLLLLSSEHWSGS
jgi:hypothetical protein